MRTALLAWLGLPFVALVACFEETDMYGHPRSLDEVVLVRVDDEPPGEHCALGGIAKRSGSDVSGDGILNEDEIVSTVYVCGCGGAVESLERLVPHAYMCPLGGTRVHARLFSDGDALHTLLEAVRAAFVALAPLPDAGAAPWPPPLDHCTLGETPRSRTTAELCVTCHRSRAPDVVTAARGALALHPVGVSYDEAYARGRVPLRPRGALPVQLPLVNGRVECTSCHSARSERRAHLAMAGLCVGCHER